MIEVVGSEAPAAEQGWPWHSIAKGENERERVPRSGPPAPRQNSLGCERSDSKGGPRRYRLAGQLAIEEHGIMGEVPADALARRQSLLLGRDDDFGTGQIEDVLTGLGRHDRHEEGLLEIPAREVHRPAVEVHPLADHAVGALDVFGEDLRAVDQIVRVVLPARGGEIYVDPDVLSDIGEHLGMRVVELVDIQAILRRDDLELDRALAVAGSGGLTGQAIQGFLDRALAAPQPGSPGHAANQIGMLHRLGGRNSLRFNYYRFNDRLLRHDGNAAVELSSELVRHVHRWDLLVDWQGTGWPRNVPRIHS